MFEHIYFSTWKRNTSFDANDVLKDESYSLFADKHPELLFPDSNYLIHGDLHSLISRPYCENERNTLIYMQSFCYGKMGENYYTDRANYSSYLLLFTYHGEGFLQYEGKEYVLKEGDLFFIDCRKHQYYRTVGSEWEHSDLHLQGLFIEQFYEEYKIHQHPIFHFSNVQLYQNALEKALRIQTGEQIHWAVRASHEFENILFLLLEHSSHITDHIQPPENIILLRTYLEHNFQQDLSLDEMSSFCNTSKYHLCREFKRYIGFSPKEYMIKLRINQAQMLLQNTKMSGYKIGIMCGFENEANFIRQFKKYSGTTPGKYRESFHC